MQEIKIGRWQHFKGNIYEVIGVARHTEKAEDFVIYKSYSGEIWARPKVNFLENVFINGQKVPRFKQVQ